MINGTPSMTPKCARLTLQTATTATPATARKAILIAVRLAGGATRPLLRLRESPSQKTVPAATTTTARTIQLTAGSNRPQKML